MVCSVVFRCVGCNGIFSHEKLLDHFLSFGVCKFQKIIRMEVATAFEKEDNLLNHLHSDDADFSVYPPSHFKKIRS